MRTHKHIFGLVLLLIMACMTMAQAIAQTKTVYAGQSSQLTVVEVHGDAYKWELYKEVTGVNFAVVPGNCPSKDAFFTGGINIGSSVNVTWITPGIYFFKVTVFQAGCTMNLKVGKMIVMKSLFPATISQPAPVCMGETADIIITLSGTAPWSIDVSDGTDTNTYSNIVVNPFKINVAPVATTSYTVTRVSDAVEETVSPSNTVNLVVNPLPDFKLNSQDTLCSENEVVLDPGVFASYEWQDGSTASQLVAKDAGLYWVVVTNENGCKGIDSVLLSPCELVIWMPNVFTPNADGLNDRFLPKYNPAVIGSFNMLIFNKWGEQIFSTNDITQGWDGTFKGEPCTVDMYTWVIRFSTPDNYNSPQKSPQQGNVMLLK